MHYFNVKGIQFDLIMIGVWTTLIFVLSNFKQGLIGLGLSLLSFILCSSGRSLLLYLFLAQYTEKLKKFSPIISVIFGSLALILQIALYGA